MRAKHYRKTGAQLAEEIRLERLEAEAREWRAEQPADDAAADDILRDRLAEIGRARRDVR